MYEVARVGKSLCLMILMLKNIKVIYLNFKTYIHLDMHGVYYCHYMNY